MTTTARSAVHWLLCSLLLGASGVSLGQEVAGDGDEIRRAAGDYLKALESGDLTAARSAWTAGGRYVNAAGQSIPIDEYLPAGKDAAEVKPDPAPATPEASTSAEASSIRFLAPTVAVEERLLGDPANTDAMVGCSTAVWVKQGDRWLLDTLHESLRPPANPLEPLGWMVGEWTAADEGSQVVCLARWSDNRRYILREFSVQRPDVEPLRGTQRIVWDPAGARIRSWVFDSDGGFSEQSWRQVDNAWVVKSLGTLSDGSRTGTVSYWLPEGKDRFVVQYRHPTVEGVEELKEVTLEFVRVPRPRTD